MYVCGNTNRSVHYMFFDFYCIFILNFYKNFSTCISFSWDICHRVLASRCTCTSLSCYLHIFLHLFLVYPRRNALSDALKKCL